MVSNGITPPVPAGARGAKPRPTKPASPPMQQRLFDTQNSEVPADGQHVIVTARWILVLSGLILALWNPGPIGQIRLQVLALLLLAVGNFYLHAQLLMRRPAVSAVAYAASAADIAVITLLVATQGGFESSLYIFYFPALLALSVAFPTSRTVSFASVAVVAYAAISLFTASTERDMQNTILRLLMLIAIPFCGNIYRRIEDNRRSTTTGVLSASPSAAQEAAEDIFFGQTVMIWARWFIILTGALLTLWTAATIAEITVNTVLIVILMAMNFFLHGRYLMERPANRTLLVAISLLDLVVIGALVLAWQGQVGLRSEFFAFYYPIVLAFAFVMQPRLTVAYTAAALVIYSAICFFMEGALFANTADLKLLTMRLITIAAMGGLGTYYWRIQRQRRRSIRGESAIDELQAQLGQAALPQ